MGGEYCSPFYLMWLGLLLDEMARDDPYIVSKKRAIFLYVPAPNRRLLKTSTEQGFVGSARVANLLN